MGLMWQRNLGTALKPPTAYPQTLTINDCGLVQNRGHGRLLHNSIELMEGKRCEVLGEIEPKASPNLPLPSGVL